MYTPRRSIVKMLSNFTFAISNNKDKIVDSCVSGGKNKVLHHRPVGKWKHYFGALRRERTHSLPLPRSENDTFHTYSSSYNI
jgi:hypothetical protein